MHSQPHGLEQCHGGRLRDLDRIHAAVCSAGCGFWKLLKLLLSEYERRQHARRTAAARRAARAAAAAFAGQRVRSARKNLVRDI